MIVFFRLVLVSPSPYFVATISCSEYPFFDHFFRDSFKIIGPAYFGKKVNEESGKVCTIFSKLWRFVVPREGMMIVVPAFTKGKDRNWDVFSGIDVSIKGTIINENILIHINLVGKAKVYLLINFYFKISPVIWFLSIKMCSWVDQPSSV